MRRRYLLRWDTVLVTILLLGGGTVVLFPKLVTGDYARITVDYIQINAEGEAGLAYPGTQSSGTWVTERFLVDGQGEPPLSGRDSGGFPPWPESCPGTLTFTLFDVRDRAAGKRVPERAELAERMTVTVGETYVVRPGRPLTVFRFTDSHGRVHEGQIEVWRWSALGLRPDEPPTPP
jgi:hypothetical protein